MASVTTPPATSTRRPASGRPTPIAWILLAAAALILILVVRTCTAASPYPEQARDVAAGSAELGAHVAGFRERIVDLDRLELFRTLKTWARTAAAQVEEASQLEPPGELRLTHGYLVGSLGLRAEALRRFEPAVRNALSETDVQVVSSQVRGVMQDLVSADRLFDLFRQGWPEDRDLPPPSQWVEPDQPTTDGAVTLVRALRDQPALDLIYNLKVAKLTVSPPPVGREGELDVLPAASSVSVAVIVENTGNQRIPAATIDAVLTSETDPEPRTAEGRIPTLGPGEKHTVTLRGLRPTAGGPVNLLSVTVGPVGGEKNLLDNRSDFKFAMRRP